MKVSRFFPLLFLFALQTSATTVYISQSGGAVSCGADGTQSTTALASVSWATSGTYKLCGTITSQVAIGAGGTSGTPLNLLFESGSSIQLPYCLGSGCINTNGYSYVTIDGQNVGSIGSTNNGSASLGYANQISGEGIYGAAASHVTIKNLTIGPIYVHDNTGNDTSGQSSAEIYFGNDAGNSNLTIDHNTLHDADMGITVNASSMTVSNNTVYNNNWMMLLGCPIATCSGDFVFGNTASGFSAWDTTSGAFHHNFVHAYGNSTGTVSNIYVYNNVIHADGVSATSWLFFSEASITLNNQYLFNNVIFATATSSAGIDLGALGSNWLVANNTIIGVYPTGAMIQGNCLATWKAVTSFTAENNIITTCGGSQMNFVSPVPVSPVVDFNVYAQENPGASYPWGYNGAQITTLAGWRTAAGGSCPSTGFDCHGSYSALASTVLNNTTGVIVGGGPANGTGANLYSTCNGQANPGLGALCYDAAGVARPASGAWDVGAYQYAVTNYSLTVSTAGAGSGTLGGSNCTTGSYASGTTVTCTQSASGGSVFAGWSGGSCTGTGSCSFSLSADSVVTATFNLTGTTVYRVLGSHTLGGGRTVQ